MNLQNSTQPPYVAVIFSSQRAAATDADEPNDGYEAMAALMESMGSQQPGFLGIETARNPDGFGITVSYWRSEGDAAAWKQVAEHLAAQQLGRQRWYSNYTTRIAHVTRDYEFDASVRDD